MHLIKKRHNNWIKQKERASSFAKVKSNVCHTVVDDEKAICQLSGYVLSE